jgi:hypothetical protein
MPARIVSHKMFIINTLRIIQSTSRPALRCCTCCPAPHLQQDCRAGSPGRRISGSAYPRPSVLLDGGWIDIRGRCENPLCRPGQLLSDHGGGISTGRCRNLRISIANTDPSASALKFSCITNFRPAAHLRRIPAKSDCRPVNPGLLLRPTRQSLGFPHLALFLLGCSLAVHVITSFLIATG